MANSPLVWPTERIDQGAVSRWVASVCAGDVGSPQVMRVKPWGVTARFEGVVLKASFTPLFPQVVNVHAVLERAAPWSAPRLIASQKVDGQLWTLFEHVPGHTAEEVGTAEALEATARQLATVQAAAAKQDLARLPGIDVRLVPQLLLEDLDDQPAELVEWLHEAQPSLQCDAAALAAIPPSLDHPDVNSTNAVLRDDGRVVLLDWEEATVGCPLFSLLRLVDDASERGAGERVTGAYLDCLPWGDREMVERAMRLAPLKLAAEARAFARGLGWAHPHTHLTSRLLGQARQRSL